MALQFSDDAPQPKQANQTWDPGDWDDVYVDLKANPFKWAYIDDVPQRTASRLRDLWAGEVDVTMRGVEKRGTRRGTLWLRYVGQ